MNSYRAGHTIEQLEARFLLTASGNDSTAVADVLDDNPPIGNDPEFIIGRVLLDVTADGFTPDDAPQAGVTVELFQDDGDGQFDDTLDMLVDTKVSDAALGRYQFGPLSDGLYFVREVVPAGIVRTAGPDHYTVLVAAGQTFLTNGPPIDDFRAPDPADFVFVGNEEADPLLLQQPGLNGVLGGERDVSVDVLGIPQPLSASLQVGRDAQRGIFSFASASPGAQVVLQYDGTDNDDIGPVVGLQNSRGLVHDLTDGGMSNGLLFTFDSLDPGAGEALQWEIHVTSGESLATFSGALLESLDPTAAFIPLFVFETDPGFSFTDIDSLQIVFNPRGVADVDFQLSMITSAADTEVGFNFGNAVLPVVSLGNAEPVEEGQSVSFAISLDRPAIVPIELAFETNDGTAQAAEDYQSRTETIVIEPGQSGATIVIDSIDDDQVEARESFFLRLLSAAGATLNTQAALGEAPIDDNDELPPGAIFGRKWRDDNADGVLDVDEPGLPGVTIYLDLNRNAALDPGEPSTLTGEDGGYRFDGLPSDTYVVREVVPEGFAQTSLPQHYTVFVMGDQVFSVSETGIDDFRSPEPADVLFVNAIDPDPALLKQSGLAGVAGGERDVLVDVIGVSSPLSANVLVGGENGRGVFAFASANPGASVTLQYDGQDDDEQGPPAGLVNARGLLVDLTDGGARDGLLFAFESIDPGADDVLSWEIIVTAGEATAIMSGVLAESSTATLVFVPFADFAGADGFAFEAADSLEIVFNRQGVANVDFELSSITTATPRATGFAFGNAPLPVISIVDAGTVGEGQTALFEVVLDRTAVVPISLTFETRDGSALADEDYRPQSDTILIDRGATGATIAIETIDDLLDEPFESFFVKLLAATGATIQSSADQGEAMIEDNDPPPPGAITGRKWLDRDGDGQIDEDEPALPGVTIYLDINGDAELNEGERSTPTDNDGGYRFDDLEPGNYVVREVIPEGFLQTFPSAQAGAAHMVTVVSEQTVDNINFGNQPIEPPPGAITGRKWLDRDGDGQADEDEPALPGVTIYLDINGNAVRDEAEPSTQTDGDGRYRLDDLEPGEYVVREVVPEGFLQTFPFAQFGAAHLVTVVSEQTVENVDFGNQLIPRPGAITGHVFSDVDGDRRHDSGEPNLPGVVVYLDQNGNGQLDPGEPSTTTAADGTYRFDNLEPGTYVVREVLPTASFQTVPGRPGGFAHVVVVEAGVAITRVDFGNQLTFGPLTTPSIKIAETNNRPAPGNAPPRVVVATPAPVGRDLRRLSRDGGGGSVERSAAHNVALVQFAELTFIDPAIEEELDELLIVLADAAAPDLLGIDPGDPPDKPKPPEELGPPSRWADLNEVPPISRDVAAEETNWWYAALLPALAGVALVWRYREPLIRQIKSLLA